MDFDINVARSAMLITMSAGLLSNSVVLLAEGRTPWKVMWRVDDHALSIPMGKAKIYDVRVITADHDSSRRGP